MINKLHYISFLICWSNHKNCLPFLYKLERKLPHQANIGAAGKF